MYKYTKHRTKTRFYERHDTETGEKSLWNKTGKEWKLCLYYVEQQPKHEDSADAFKFTLALYKKVLWDDPKVAPYLPPNENPKRNKQSFRKVLNRFVKMDNLNTFVFGKSNENHDRVGGFWDSPERIALLKEWEEEAKPAEAPVATQQQPPASPQVVIQSGAYIASGAIAAGATVNFNISSPAPATT